MEGGGGDRMIIKPRLPKGTRDFGPKEMALRQHVFNVIRTVFKNHGAVEIDTPIFELKETLMGKYGEDTKLIFDLDVQGDEEPLSLRYDLTVPLARYVAMNCMTGIKRYHIGKVYRRDQPQIQRGRYREFYQCDFDIVGTYSKGYFMPDIEVLKIICEILDALQIGKYIIKINHRVLLDNILSLCSVPTDKFRTICSSIDKLDKKPWETVRTEMIEEKGLSIEMADKIGTYVRMHGKPHELLRELREMMIQGDVIWGELQHIFSTLEGMGVLDKIQFDLSLARGLDYYTGIIYEAVLCDDTSIPIGTIAAGGRYDNLIGMFNPMHKNIPAIGISIGMERIFTVLEDKIQNMDTNTTDVLVASVGGNLTQSRFILCAELWNAGIRTELLYDFAPRMKDQIEYALNKKIPLIVLIGETEINKGIVQVKDVQKNTFTEVARNTIVPYLISIISKK